MDEPVKHHIVPKCYLNQFTNGRNKIYKLKINEKKVRNTLREWHVSQVCYKNNFYTVTNINLLKKLNISDKNYLEKKGFNWYENKLESILKFIRKRQTYLTPKDAEILIGGLIHIKFRNEFRINTFPTNNIVENICDKAIKSLKTNSSWINILANENTSINEAISQVNEMKEKWLSDPDLSRNLQNERLLTSIIEGDKVYEKVKDITLNCHWQILETTITNMFITSDNPGFCIDDEEVVHNTKFGGTFSFFFPLTPFHCLYINNESIDNITSVKRLKFIDANYELVKLINYATCFNANVEIYSNSEITLQKSFIEYNNNKQIKNNDLQKS